MKTAVVLNVIGLFIGLVAAILMYYCPPRVTQYTENGEPPINFVGNATGEGKRRGTWQLRLSRVAPCLLAVAFLLQLIAALLPVGPTNGPNPSVERGAPQAARSSLGTLNGSHRER